MMPANSGDIESPVRDEHVYRNQCHLGQVKYRDGNGIPVAEA